MMIGLMVKLQFRLWEYKFDLVKPKTLDVAAEYTPAVYNWLKER